jgi:hypothetical protein
VRILFNDIIQYSDAHDNLKSPSLADIYNIKNGYISFNFDKVYTINSIGVGNTDGTFFKVILRLVIDGKDAAAINYNLTIDANAAAAINYTHVIDSGSTGSYFNIKYDTNGLYLLNKNINASTISIETDATYIGRFGAGLAVNIPTSIAKQPGWNSTNKSRKTLSGNIIAGAGGYNYKTLSLDSRYKLNKDAIDELEAGYNIIGQGYPYFINLETESYKLPYNKLYGTEKNQHQIILESGVKRFLYSYRFIFEEAF